MSQFVSIGVELSALVGAYVDADNCQRLAWQTTRWCTMRARLLVLVAAGTCIGAWLSIDDPKLQSRERQWIKIVFGVDGATADWSGHLTVHNGKPLEFVEWGLEAEDAIDPTTASWTIKSGLHWPGHQVGKSFAEPQRGILIQLYAAPDARVQLHTRQGSFDVRPSKLIAGRPTAVLSGRATAERLGSAELVCKTETEDDFPGVTLGPAGRRFVAWIAYDDRNKTDQLLCRCIDDPNDNPEPIATGKEFAGVQLVGGSTQPPTAIWCAPDAAGNWDLYAAQRGLDGWSKPEQLTAAPNADVHPAAKMGSDGSIWLAWQSFRNGNSDIYVKRRVRDKWSVDIGVATGAANEWEPSIAVDGGGNAWVGYDTYEHGNYDVYVVPVSATKVGIKPGAPVAVARSDEFEAHASVAVDDADRVWVAFDVAGPNWGKDFSRGETRRGGVYAEPLHAARRLGLRCLTKGQVYQLSNPLPQKPAPRHVSSVEHGRLGNQTRFYEHPQLFLDGERRLWLFFRLNRQGYSGHPKKGGVWDVFATTHTENGWLEPIQIPRSAGRQNQRVAATIGPSGELLAAWSDGSHHVDRKYTVHFGRLPAPAELHRFPALEPLRDVPAPKPEPIVNREATMSRGKEQWRLFFGDLHRHTDISLCTPTIDGSLVDAYRYALDAAALDFLAVTDHTRDTDPFPWWRTQKAADLFHVHDRFIPIYAYERSNTVPGGGHRNVFFLERGWEVNHADYLQRPTRWPSADPDVALYPWLKEKGGAFTAAHTPAFHRGRNRGTWTFNDPQVEPVAEIFQAYRRSYERPDPDRSSDKVENVPIEASIWYALAQGYRLGFIASSDHHSTHLSYACVWAKDKSRRELFDAISARRTYAATDRIVVDFRVGEAVMGEETVLPGRTPVLSIGSVGTAPISEVEIIRSGQVIHTFRPNQRRVSLTWTDRSPLAGRSYYYIRVRQQDDNFAWSSPVWVIR